MALKYFRPKTVERNTGSYAASGAPTLPQACDLIDETPTHDEDTSVASRGSGGAAGALGFSPDFDFSDKMASIATLTVFARFRWEGATGTIQVFVVLGGADTNSGSLSPTTSYTTVSAALARPGGGNWTEADFRDSTFGWGIKYPVNPPSAQRLTSSWAVADYTPASQKILPHREAMSRDIYFRRFTPEIWSADVPPWWASLELFDPLNVSHESIPRAASALVDIDDKILIDEWRRQRGTPVRITIPNLGKPNDNIEIEYVDTEHYDCIARSTDKLPFSISERLDGLAQMDGGADHRFSRDSVAWLRQSDGKYASVQPSRIKMNDVGAVFDEARTNLVTNANFQAGVSTDWTSFGDGTVVNETTIIPFVDSDAYPNSCKVTMGTTDTGVQQGSMSVLSTDVRRTLAFLYYDSTGRSVWSLQRASDSKWWNDSTEAWEVSKAWNLLAASVDVWARQASNPIITDVTTTWTIQIGKDTANSLQNDVSYFGEVDNVQGRYVVTPLLTDGGATFTSERDEFHLRYDLLVSETFRQMWDPERGQHRVTYLEENDASRMADGDKRVVAIGRFGKNKDWVKVWQVDATGPTFVDITTDANDTGASDASPFPASEAVGDYVAFGLSTKFGKLMVNAGTVGVGGVVAWEYWDGAAWSALGNVTDPSAGFTVTGEQEVTYDFPSDWALTSLNGSNLYYVRARVTTVYSTNPILTQAQARDFADDYDAMYYEKPAGGNARFVLERVRSAVSEGKATKEIDTVRGTSYELAFRVTDQTELGLSALTARVSVDGAKGTDVQFTGQHSASELYTELWLGSASPVFEMLNVMAFLSDRETIRVVDPDERIQAMR